MNSDLLIKVLKAAGLLLFVRAGIYLFDYTSWSKPFTEELLINDRIWLDFWALAFVAALVIAYNTNLRLRFRSLLMIALLGVFGFVAVSLILDGTPFGTNAYWGDQKFRTAMITHYFAFGNWGDMYYKDLPSFYPPIYYYLLAIVAKVTSLKPFMMLKAGTLAIYLVWPFLLYFLWRRVLSPMRAFGVTLATFLFCSAMKSIPFSAPHAFIGNSAFIPFWLHYIERVGVKRSDWKFYLIGGIIGAAIFMTYYYGFFIGGLLLIIHALTENRYLSLKLNKRFALLPTIIVLAISAVLSTPFWLPLLVSVISNGYNPAQQRWHHSGSVGIGFPFLSMTFPALAYLIAICYSIRMRRQSVYRALLLLLVTIPLFYLIGTYLGAVDHPINLIKANEFLIVLAGPFVGLMFMALLRRIDKRRKRTRLIPGLLTVSLLIILLHNFNNYAAHDFVRKARAEVFPSWRFDPNDAERQKGKVFLTGYEELMSFKPVYSFIAHNEHYSNPASRFTERFEMLSLLQRVQDPRLFHYVLRHNRFDAVDYFMPRRDGDGFRHWVSLSNYPNRHAGHNLLFDTSLVTDSTLFIRRNGDNLYELTAENSYDTSPIQIGAKNSRTDSMLVLASLHNLVGYVRPEHQRTVRSHIPDIDMSWRQLTSKSWPHSLADSVVLLSIVSATAGDTVNLFLLFRSECPAMDRCRILLATNDNEEGVPLLFEKKVDQWRKGDLVFGSVQLPLNQLEQKYRVRLIYRNEEMAEAEFEI